MKDRKIFITPPPNLTGSLHLGHYLNLIIQDFEIRRSRYINVDNKLKAVIGFDHAALYAEIIAKQQVQNASDLANQIRTNAKSYASEIKNDMESMGLVQDWDNVHFTFSELAKTEVQNALFKLKTKGLLFERKIVAKWDPVAGSVLSDLETYAKDEVKTLYYVTYSTDNGPISVATTMPETMFADVAVACQAKLGQTATYATLPITGKVVPMIFSDLVIPNFGSGYLKVTPQHDDTDLAIYEKETKLSKADLSSVINLSGLIDLAHLKNDLPAELFTAMHLKPIEVARTAVVDHLNKLGLITKIEKINSTTSYSSRTHSRVVPILTKQLFFKLDLVLKTNAEKILSSVKFLPEKYTQHVTRLIAEAKPWCISRQNSYGHQIPKSIFNSGGVLDTWFSSAMWSYLCVGDLSLLKNVIIVTGKDILFFWILKMCALHLALFDQLPFGEVWLHGLLSDAKGVKMSKSKNNGITIKTAMQAGEVVRLHLLSLDVGAEVIKVNADYSQSEQLMNQIEKLIELASSNAKLQTDAGSESAFKWVAGAIYHHRIGVRRLPNLKSHWYVFNLKAFLNEVKAEAPNLKGYQANLLAKYLLQVSKPLLPLTAKKWHLTYQLAQLPKLNYTIKATVGKAYLTSKLNLEAHNLLKTNDLVKLNDKLKLTQLVLSKTLANSPDNLIKLTALRWQLKVLKSAINASRAN